MNRLLTVSEVAKILGVNRNFVYRLIKDGKLQAYKVGSLKLRESEVEEYIKSCQQ